MKKGVKRFFIHVKILHTMDSMHQKLEKPHEKFSQSGFEPYPYRGATPLKVLGMPFRAILGLFRALGRIFRAPTTAPEW